MPALRHCAVVINDCNWASVCKRCWQGTGFGFAGEAAKLDPPDRAILSYATGDAELLSQLLLVLLRTSLIANGPDLHHKVLPLALCEAACGVTIAGEVAGVVDGAVTTGCGAGVGSLPSSTPGAKVVGAPRKPLLVTGAPVGSSLLASNY